MSRWRVCPGSVRLSRGRSDTTSIYAEAGRLAHALAERCLIKGHDPLMYLGYDLGKQTVDRETVLAVDDYIRVVRPVRAACSWSGIELRVSLDRVFADAPPSPMFGTADFVGYRADRHELVVVDLKFGRGVVVEIIDNDQLRYYALGALLIAQDKGLSVRDVRMIIVQPRADHEAGRTREEVISAVDLLIWGDTVLVPAAMATTDPNAPLVTGDHCRFCRAAGACPQLHKKALERARDEFGTLMPEPAGMSDAALARALDDAWLLMLWIGAVRGEASARLDRGRAIPGWKLVDRRATRRWLDEGQALGAMVTSGLPDVTETKLRSPAQIEQIMKTERWPKARIDAVLSTLVDKSSSGTTLAQDSDPRQPAGGPASEFDVVDEHAL